LWFEADNDVGTVEITEKDDIFTLTVSLKIDCEQIKIRIPERVDVKNILLRGNSAEIIYEMKTETTIEMLCGERLTVTWCGNVVTDISPKGIIPLYDND